MAIRLSKTKLKTLEVCETAIKINCSRPGQGADGKCGLVFTSSAQLDEIISKGACVFKTRYYFNVNIIIT